MISIQKKLETKQKTLTIIHIKALETRYILMDCYLFDIHWLSEVLGGARNGEFDIKLTDGATIFSGNMGNFECFSE